MAKEDFCFTYYDGDAARDKYFLNRLQKGAYHDLISAQRNFGHLTLKAIQMILEDDFESCWPAIERVLKKDEHGDYYIEWVENSIQAMKTKSKIQKEKVDNYWRKVNADEIEHKRKKKSTIEIPQYNN